MDPFHFSRHGTGFSLPFTKDINQHKVSGNKNNSLIKDTLELLEEGEKEIELRDEFKDVTLVLGNTGSGKSTFTQWVAGDNSKLISVEVKEGTGEYIIVDNNRIGNSTVQSKTIFPELVTQNDTQAAYYDCPGFSDTRSTSHDIATTYFIKKVLDFSERVKMIFVISHPSVRKGVDRQDFMKLLRHATDLIKDIDKFKNSIALVATKVDNQYIKQGKNFVLVADSKIIEAIADFLQEVRQYLEQTQKDLITSQKEQKFYDNAIKFINALLVKDDDRITKIGIFRRPEEPGPLSEIALLREGKTHVEKIIYEKLSFAEKNENDFGYTVSQKSKNDINDLVEEINKKIWSDVSRIAEKIQVLYRSSIEQMQLILKSFVSSSAIVDVNLLDAESFSFKFTKGYNITTGLVDELENVTNPEEIAKILNRSISNLNIDVSNQDILDITNQGKYISFLQVVSDKKFSTRPWAEIFKSTLAFLSESRRSIQTEINDVSEKINSRMQSEFVNIANMVQKHYTEKIKSLEIQILPDILTKDKKTLSNIADEIKNIENAKDLIKMFQDNANTLKIDIPKNSMVNITILSKYLEFLQIVSDKELNISVSRWISPFNDVISYLDRSEKWYEFLNALYTKFSEYEIQKNRQAYNVANLEDWGKTGKAQGIAITKSSFHVFLNKLKDYNLQQYDNVKDISLTELQIEEVNQILTLTLKHKPKIQCVEPYVLIKGDYINIEEIISEINHADVDDKCKDRLTVLESGKFKFIHVFALKSIFIDKDVFYPGLKLPITFIAPKWEIIGSKEINLNGIDGKPHSKPNAKDGSYSNRNGENGAPGEPGGSGGTFFGISEKIVNGENLTITVNGGNGGNGQGGGYGYKGNDGISPSPPSGYECKGDYWEIKGFKCQKLDYFFIRGGCYGNGAGRECIPDRCYCKYKMFGKSGERGGDGGQGGRRGKGGYAGNIMLLELNDDETKVLKHCNEGKIGNNGIGGKGGSGGRNGDDIITESRCPSYKKEWNLKERTYNNYAPSGKSGTDGANDQGIKKLEEPTVIKEPAQIINQYKGYLRENLNDRFKKYSLNTFLQHLDNSRNVRNIYDTSGLVDEMQHIEKQFHALNEGIDFIPFYKSLLNRVSEYSEHPIKAESSVQYKKTLGYLYTAILSRIFNLKDHSEFNLIVDIKGYLEIVKGDIETLKDMQKDRNKADIIKKYNENYKNNVDNKIEEARNFIKNQISPEIKNINNDIDNNIDLLIAETIEMQNKAKEEKEELIEKKQELEKALAIKGVFSFFKIVSQVVSFLGPVGAAIGSVIGTATSVSQSLVLDNQQGAKLPSGVVTNLKTLGEQIKTIRNRKLEDLNKLLEELSRETRDYPEILGDTSDKIKNIKNRLNNVDSNQFDFKETLSMENELKKELERKEIELKADKDVIDQKTKKALKVIEKFNQIVQFGSVLLDIFNNHKHDAEEIEVLIGAIDQAEEKFQLLRQYEEEIYYTLTPLLQNMENNLQNVANSLDGKSQVSLDVAKWKVQSALKDMKLKIQKFTQGFDITDNLARCIEKLDEVMTTLINVYDRVQTYEDQQNLSDYIADISSASASSIEVSNSTLGKSVNDLEIIIRSNLVLNQYKTVINAFQQWVFPFAHRYLKASQLPSHLKLDENIEDLVSDVVKQIEDIKRKVDLYNVTVKKGDQYILTGDFNSYYFSTKPFFVWKNEQIGNVISKLLSGENVVLKADVNDSERNKDAIKFRNVEFHLKTKNITMQSQLNNVLKGFDVKATHFGNSYYRYADKIYLITSDSQSIYRSYETNNNGEPVRRNDVFIKIKNGDLMLSPYTTWEIKLINLTDKISFKDLQFYKSKVDLELSGSGSYVFRNVFSFNKNEYKAIDSYNHSYLYNESESKCFPLNFHCRRSINQAEVKNDNYMTNSAVSGMSSPINHIFNLIKMYVMSNVAISVSLNSVGRGRILDNDDNENKIHKRPHLTDIEEGRFGNDIVDHFDVSSKEATEKAAVDELETKNQIIQSSPESIPPSEKTNSKDGRISLSSSLFAVPSANFDDFDKSATSFLPNSQDVEHHIPLPQVPDINCSLLLLDLITRSVTGNKYKCATEESLLLPTQKLQRKINECTVQSELDLRRNLTKLISEMESNRQKQSSWFKSLKNYVRSTFQFLGLVEKEDIDSYVQDLRYLFNAMN
ncbi:uncharacterized protein NPIL_616951 [Nephila pilipes]|uniref:G domain-containing protein n=1 Tax=Nephila pilipes TaxID=299642 RepID=A0A8X6MBC8_NEPPI|nr:uncharacterized protein NPIL_616951 [Nephila pilipes]